MWEFHGIFKGTSMDFSKLFQGKFINGILRFAQKRCNMELGF